MVNSGRVTARRGEAGRLAARGGKAGRLAARRGEAGRVVGGHIGTGRACRHVRRGRLTADLARRAAAYTYMHGSLISHAKPWLAHFSRSHVFLFFVDEAYNR